MDTISIIMCDGLGIRWNNSDIRYKQLIPLDDTTIITRTIYQLEKYDTEILVIAPDDFKPYINNHRITTLGYRDNQERTLIDGIVRTRDFWKYRTNIILGDVIFSNRAIDLLFYYMDYEFIIGRTGRNKVTGKLAAELFALSFAGFHAENVFQRMLKMSGKLWNYYYKFHPPLFNPEDYTDDIDSPQAYDQFYQRMLYAVRGDK